MDEEIERTKLNCRVEASESDEAVYLDVKVTIPRIARIPITKRLLGMLSLEDEEEKRQKFEDTLTKSIKDHIRKDICIHNFDDEYKIDEDFKITLKDIKRKLNKRDPDAIISLAQEE